MTRVITGASGLWCVSLQGAVKPHCHVCMAGRQVARMGWTMRVLGVPELERVFVWVLGSGGGR